MNTSHRIGIVLLAAGNAERFGSAKQLLSIDGVSLVRRCATMAMNTGARVVVVTGAYRELVEGHLSDLSVIPVFNPDWPLGMGSSIACGIDHVRRMNPSLNATIITLADQPLITSAELMQLITAHIRAPQRIIATTCNDVLGPPCLFPQAYYDDLANLRGSRGARALLDLYAEQVDGLSISSSTIDIDTPEDLARLHDSRLTNR